MVLSLVVVAMKIAWGALKEVARQRSGGALLSLSTQFAVCGRHRLVAVCHVACSVVLLCWDVVLFVAGMAGVEHMSHQGLLAIGGYDGSRKPPLNNFGSTIKGI